jgi:hypothetical protein
MAAMLRAELLALQEYAAHTRRHGRRDRCATTLGVCLFVGILAYYMSRKVEPPYSRGEFLCMGALYAGFCGVMTCFIDRSMAAWDVQYLACLGRVLSRCSHDLNQRGG